MNYLIIYLIIHLVCGFFAYGIDFAHFQRKFPSIAKEKYREDLGTAILLGFSFGPLALIISLFLTGFAKHGLKFR